MEAEAEAGAGSMIFVDVLSERESRSELAEIRSFGDWAGKQAGPSRNHCATHSCLAAVAAGVTS